LAAIFYFWDLQKVYMISFRSMSPIVKNLLIVNGLCFLANVVIEARFNYSINEFLGLYYPESTHFKPYQLITHVFFRFDKPL
jgi:hypothetical protein